MSTPIDRWDGVTPLSHDDLNTLAHAYVLLGHVRRGALACEDPKSLRVFEQEMQRIQLVMEWHAARGLLPVETD